MAIVTFGGGVTAIRGLLGGNVFSANKSGAFVRNWAAVHNPQTIGQEYMRAYTANMPALWAALSDGQRTDWNDYGDAHPLTNPLNQTYYRTGFQWMCHCNLHLLKWGGSLAPTAPTVAAPATRNPNSFTYEFSGGSHHVTIDFDADLFADAWALISFYPIPYGVNMSWPTGYYLLRAVYDPDPADTAISFWLAHTQKFGDPQDGWKGFVRVCTGDTQGLQSQPWEAATTFTTP
jgi:hypothetical protein